MKKVMFRFVFIAAAVCAIVLGTNACAEDDDWDLEGIDNIEGPTALTETANADTRSCESDCYLRYRYGKDMCWKIYKSDMKAYLKCIQGCEMRLEACLDTCDWLP